MDWSEVIMPKIVLWNPRDNTNTGIPTRMPITHLMVFQSIARLRMLLAHALKWLSNPFMRIQIR